MPFTKDQWPDNIESGYIRYGKANNYDGFYLADDSHGIPTFGSVSDESPPSIRGQHVRVFNYPGQTEAIAKRLVLCWNFCLGLTNDELEFVIKEMQQPKEKTKSELLKEMYPEAEELKIPEVDVNDLRGLPIKK